jgi:hypothetical protein
VHGVDDCGLIAKNDITASKGESPEMRNEELRILAPMTGSVTLHIKGKTPFICNAPAEKARHELLLPRKKTASERATQLKHDPLLEYRNSAYCHLGDQTATRVYFPAGGFKKSMMSAALETPGASKSSIARLLWVEGLNVDLYGVPKLLTSMTRSADFNRTPDIRTRAILPQWAARLTIAFISPRFNQQMVGNLLLAAGLMIGVGDWRQEKGSGSYGQFVLCSEQEFNAIAEHGGREAQDAAFEHPAYYDGETQKLMEWFDEEVIRRTQAGDAAAQNSRRNRHAEQNGNQSEA